IDNPYGLKFILNKPMEGVGEDGGDEPAQQSGWAADMQLLKMLKDLRKKIAKQRGLPPFVIFQDPSLDEMCTHYPITIDELKQIHGVGAGKAFKFGGKFIELIKQYVEENDVDRPQDLVIKGT